MRRIRSRRAGEFLLDMDRRECLLILVVLVAFRSLVVVERLISTIPSKSGCRYWKILLFLLYERRCLARTRTESSMTRRGGGTGVSRLEHCEDGYFGSEVRENAYELMEHQFATRYFGLQ
jgi:hypothetical protein